MTTHYFDDKDLQFVFECMKWSLIHCLGVTVNDATNALKEHYEQHKHHRVEDRYYWQKDAFSISLEVYYENILGKEIFTDEFWSWRKRTFPNIPEQYLEHERKQYK